MSAVKATPEYVEFIEDDEPSRRKTGAWWVKSKRHGYVLGRIAWNGGWRQYVFTPMDSIWSAGCMVAVAEFIAAQMAARSVVVA